MAALATLMLGGAARAQSPKQLWLVYSGDHAIGRRTALLLDAQSRRTVDGPYYRQILMRPALAYALSSRVRVMGGWTFARTTEDSDELDEAERAADPRPHQIEHRLWEMAQLTHRAGEVSLRHRVRLEQRWVHPHEVSEWERSQRVRYQLQGAVPVDRLTLSVAEEVFGGFGGTAGTLSFDQSRTSAGLTLKVAPTTSLGAGYLLQAIAHPREGFSERRHALQLTLSSTAPIVKR
jgi:hypothetical protein